MSQSFAQEIIAGDATSYSKVETNIQGNGSVKTHIEVEANGEKKVLDVDKPGTYELKVGVDTNIQENSPSPTKSSSKSALLGEEKEKNVIDSKTEKKSLILIVFEGLANFLQRIFNNL